MTQMEGDKLYRMISTLSFYLLWKENLYAIYK